MVVFQREPAVASDKAPIKAAEVKRFEKTQVVPGKFWKVTYQLGPNRGHANVFPSNAWKKRTDQPPGERPVYDPVYKVFEQVLDSQGVMSLIQKNNSWQAANVRHQVAGEIGKMLAILDIVEAKDYVPDNLTFLHGGMPMQIFKMIVDSAVEARLKNSK